MTELALLKITSLLFSTGFIALAWLSKKAVGSWLNPSSIFSLFWTLYTILPLLMAFDAPINPLSIFYILAFNIFFMSSIFLFNWKAAFLRNMRKPTALEVYGTKSFRFCFYISVTISVSTLLLSLLDLGVSFSERIENCR